MNLQHDRIVHLCQQLRFVTLADQYSALAQAAASQETSYPDFLEQALGSEVASRQARSRSTLARLAGFPAIKTLDGFDFEFAAGVPKPQLLQLASLTFIERNENVVLLGPSGVGKTHCDNRSSMARGRQRCQAAPHRTGMTPRLIGAPCERRCSCFGYVSLPKGCQPDHRRLA